MAIAKNTWTYCNVEYQCTTNGAFSNLSSQCAIICCHGTRHTYLLLSFTHIPYSSLCASFPLALTSWHATRLGLGMPSPISAIVMFTLCRLNENHCWPQPFLPIARTSDQNVTVASKHINLVFIFVEGSEQGEKMQAILPRIKDARCVFLPVQPLSLHALPPTWTQCSCWFYLLFPDRFK